MRLSAALDEIVIDGIPTTVPVHRAILRNRVFRSGELSTHFIEDHLRLRRRCPAVSGDEAAALSAAFASALGIVKMPAPTGPYTAVPRQVKWVMSARRDTRTETGGGSRYFEPI